MGSMGSKYSKMVGRDAKSVAGEGCSVKGWEGMQNM